MGWYMVDALYPGAAGRGSNDVLGRSIGRYLPDTGSNATVGGEVSIGDRNFIGFSATIGQQRRIGNDVLIGAQSLLLSDVTNLVHYQGIPARKVEIVDKLRGICFD